MNKYELKKGKILETQRLRLREFNIHDSKFILRLLNSPNWLEFIGDKNIRTEKDALNYLKDGPINSYKKNGYGLWLVELKDSDVPIGMCGLVNRETLEDIDIGFAILPDYLNLGYGFEIANATMYYAKNNLNLDKIIAITDCNNIASIKLLNKIGLSFERTLELSDEDSVLVFSPSDNAEDEIEIGKLMSAFYGLFDNTDGRVPELNRIKDLFIAKGVIVSNTDGSTEIFNLETFIVPREKLLTKGILTDFSEHEISHKTEIYRNIAHRLSLYKKSGKRNDVYFERKGVKTIQFIKVDNEWKISSVAWNDE